MVSYRLGRDPRFRAAYDGPVTDELQDDDLAGARPDGFTVLFVGGAGVTRAPIAELLLQHAVGLKWGRHGKQWIVRSAGLDHQAGAELNPLAKRVLEERGVVIGDFQPRVVNHELLASADLILTMERVHRSRVATELPAALNHVFTLRQFIALAEHVPTLESTAPRDQGRELVSSALLHRADGILPPNQLDIADPGIRSRRRVRSIVRQISAVVDTVLRPSH